jgi:uncharacterized MnhB-related membrane protein
MSADPRFWIVIALVPSLALVAVAIVRARSLVAIALFLAATSALSAATLLALEAPDAAMAEIVFGAAFVAPLYLGVVTLAANTAAPARTAVAAIVAVGAVAGLLVWACADLPALGAPTAGDHARVGHIYVTRAWAESGVRNATAAVLANYRLIDSLAALIVVFAAALGAYGVLGFGERSALRRPLSPPGGNAS